MDKQPLRPQWIEKMYPGKSGRDHLGLGSVSSGQILTSLSPSINVLTFHPRYHSFYVFLLDEFWRRDLPRSFESWVNFFRPRDFIYSLGANLCDQPEHDEMGNIVGGQKTGPLASQAKTEYEYDPSYIKNALGGYGLYYRTVMAEVGLIYPGGPGFPYPVDLPTEYGKDVASAFRETIRVTEYYQSYFDNPIPVPTKVILEFIRRSCLCQLQSPEALDRPFLLDSFLHHGIENSFKARRATFRFFLDLATQTDGYCLDENTFRQLIYFGSSMNGISYKPIRDVKSIALRWRYYQAREYYAFALNGMWYYLCEWGIQHGGNIRPIPLANLWMHLDEALNFTSLAARIKLPDPGIKSSSRFSDLLLWLRNSVNATDHNFDLFCGIDSPIQEHQLYLLALENRNRADMMVAGMITMLAFILLRFSSPDLRIQPEWEIARMGAGLRLDMDGFIRKFQAKMKNENPTIGEITQWIIQNDVILQHELIATNKLPENTFRFRREGSSLRFNNLINTLEFMSSRFNAISTTIHELGFCGKLTSQAHTLSQDGLSLLRTGDL